MKNIEQELKKLGKYLYTNIDGSYKINYGPQLVDVFLVVYYQFPEYSKDPRESVKYSELYEMHININLTCYSNKIRVNIIELSPDEMTLGQIILPQKFLNDEQGSKEYIEEKIRKYINKYYEGYEFIY